jgi:hypothetical protein
MAIGGSLVDRKYKPGALKEIVVEGELRERVVRITGLEATDHRAFCSVDEVGIEDEQGRVVRIERRSRSILEKRASRKSWDVVDLVQYCGCSVWSYVAPPYLLQVGGVTMDDAGTGREEAQTLRMLRVEFPEVVATYPPRQTLFFDRQGQLVRTDYDAPECGGARVSESVSAHQEFSGLVVPTLRRARLMGAKDTARVAPILDVEIFDLDFSYI